MSDNVHRLRPPTPAVPTALEMADALADTIAISDKVGAELERLGNGIVALRNEWWASDSADLREASKRLRDLLSGRS